MKPTTRTCHATRILLELAKHGSQPPLRASALSTAAGISSKLLEKIVRPLRAAGLVRSARGATGGYVLGVDPTEITLGKILTVMEGAVFTPQCCETDNDCQLISGCPTGRVWVEISRKIEESFNATSLADLMRTPKQGCPGDRPASRSAHARLAATAEVEGKAARRRRPRVMVMSPRTSGRNRLANERYPKAN